MSPRRELHFAGTSPSPRARGGRSLAPRSRTRARARASEKKPGGESRFTFLFPRSPFFPPSRDRSRSRKPREPVNERAHDRPTPLPHPSSLRSPSALVHGRLAATPRAGDGISRIQNVPPRRVLQSRAGSQPSPRFPPLPTPAESSTEASVLWKEYKIRGSRARVDSHTPALVCWYARRYVQAAALARL